MLSKATRSLLVLLVHSCLALPAPIFGEDDNHAVPYNSSLSGRDDTHDLNPIEKGMLDDQQRAYPGIYWPTAYPGGEAPRGSPRDGGCLVIDSTFWLSTSDSV